MNTEPAIAAMGSPQDTLLLRRLLNRRRLLRLFSFSSAQVMVQILGFAAGLLLVRVMAQTDYGHYTALLTVVGLGTVLLDLGLSAAMLSLGGPHHATHAPLAQLLADAYRLQWRLSALLLLPLAAGGAALLVRQGVPTMQGAGLLALCLATSVMSARNAVAFGLLRLRGEIGLQQRLELSVHLARVAAVAGAALGHIDLVVATVTMALPTMLMALLLRRALRQRLGHLPPAGGDFTPALGDFVRRQAPNSLYYCFSGQLAVWLIGWFGQAHQVAEVGALGRLALLFTVIGSVLSALVLPYFARPRLPGELRYAFLLINALFAALTLALLLLALTVPQALLWVLGPRYLHLAPEAVWMVLAAALSAWSGAVYAMGAARGWVTPGRLVIPVGVGSLTIALALVDLGTVAGAFQINAAASAAATLLVLSYVYLRLVRHLSGLPGESPT